MSALAVALPRISVSMWSFAGPCGSCGTQHEPVKQFNVGSLPPFYLCRRCVWNLRGFCTVGEGP